MLQMLLAYPKHKLQPRLGDIFPFLCASRCVIGINSLALLEALLTEAQIICPYWADARQDSTGLVLSPDDKETAALVHFVVSPRAMQKQIERICKSRPRLLDTGTRQRRIDLFRRYFHYPANQTSTQSVEEFIRKVI